MAGQRTEQNALRAARKRGPLQSLTTEQLRLSDRAVTIVPERQVIWGHAWVRFGDADVRCVVRILRWTADAVGVELSIDEDTMRCWIWQGAVDRIDQPADVW